MRRSPTDLPRNGETPGRGDTIEPKDPDVDPRVEQLTRELAEAINDAQAGGRVVMRDYAIDVLRDSVDSEVADPPQPWVDQMAGIFYGSGYNMRAVVHAILSSRRTPIPLEDLMARLEGSKSTVLRAIATMKDYLNAPIVFDKSAGGYKYDKLEGEAYELPGLWFSANELQALAIMQRLLEDAGGGLLEEHLGPLATRLQELTRHQHLNLGEAAGRLRFPAVGLDPAIGPVYQPGRICPACSNRCEGFTMRTTWKRTVVQWLRKVQG